MSAKLILRKTKVLHRTSSAYSVSFFKFSYALYNYSIDNAETRVPNLLTNQKSNLKHYSSVVNATVGINCELPKEFELKLARFNSLISCPFTTESLEESWDLYCYIVRYHQLHSCNLVALSSFLDELLRVDSERKELLNRCHRIIRDCHLEGLAFPIETYKRLLRICGDGKYLTEMISLLDDVKLAGVKLDTESYNILLRTFGKEGNKKLVSRFYKEMREENFLPDVVTLYNLVSLDIHLSRIEEAELIFFDLLPIVSSNDKGHILEKTYCLLVRSLIRMNDYIKAEKWYTELVKTDGIVLTTRGYNTGIQLYRKLDKTPERLLDTYQQLKKSNVSPNVHTFVPLLSGLIEMNQAHIIFDFIFELKEFGFNEHLAIKNIILRGYVSLGKMEEALILLEEMRDNSQAEKSIDVITYSEIIRGFCVVDDLEKARFWFQEMIKDGVKPDTLVYNILIHHHMRLQQVQQGISYFNELLKLPESAPDASTYSSVICGLLENNQIDEAMNAYYHMKGREITPTLSNFTQLIQALGKIGKMELAMKLFEDMQVMGVEPNNYTYSAMLQGLANAKALDPINDLYMMIKMDTTRDPDIILWNSLMNAYNVAGDFSAAVQIWDMLYYTDYPLDSCSVSIIIDCCSHHMEPDHFHAIWKILVSKQFPFDDNNYSSYVEGLARMGEIKLAIEFVTRDMKALGKAPSEKTISTLLGFLRKYEKSSEQRKVMAVYLKDSFPELAPFVSKILAEF